MNNPREVNMAPEKKKKGRPFGKDKHAPLREYTRADFTETSVEFFQMQLSQAIEMLKDPKIPVMKALIGKCLIDAIKKGDFRTLEFFLNRIIGKPEQTVVMQGNIHHLLMKAAENAEFEKRIELDAKVIGSQLA